jgi:hypothetical protein
MIYLKMTKGTNNIIAHKKLHTWRIVLDRLHHYSVIIVDIDRLACSFEIQSPLHRPSRQS